MTQNEKASSHLKFANLLLSVSCRKIKSELIPQNAGGGMRRVLFNLEIEIAEDQYQLCRDLAFAQLLDNALKKEKGSVKKDSKGKKK